MPSNFESGFPHQHKHQYQSTLIPKVTDIYRNYCLIIHRSQHRVSSFPIRFVFARRKQAGRSLSQSLLAASCRLLIVRRTFSSSAVDGRRNGPTFHLSLRLLLRDLVGLVNSGLNDLLFFRRESVSQLLVECWLRLRKSWERTLLVYCGPPTKAIVVENLH